jgi:hypothetical protein
VHIDYQLMLLCCETTTSFTQSCSCPCVICHIKQINNFGRNFWNLTTSKENKFSNRSGCRSKTRLRERELRCSNPPPKKTRFCEEVAAIRWWGIERVTVV